MKNISLIIFDLDGTLLDAYPAIIRSFNFTMKKCGYPAQDPSVIRRAVGWGDENLLKPFVRKEDLAKALAVYRRHHKDALRTGSRLFPGVRRMLASLKKKGYRLAVASNRPTAFSLLLLRHLRIIAFFDYYLCADTLTYGKPNPEILNRICKKFSSPRREAVYVGDMAIDAEAGRRARIKTIVVPSGSSTRPELKKEKPYRIIRRITDLMRII